MLAPLALTALVVATPQVAKRSTYVLVPERDAPALGAACSAPGVTCGDSLTERRTDLFGPEFTQWSSGAFGVPRLSVCKAVPPQGGELVQVDITLTGQLFGSASIENRGLLNKCVGQIELAALMETAPVPPIRGVELMVSLSQSFEVSLAPFDGVVDFEGPSGVTLQATPFSQSSCVRVTDPSALAAFVGAPGEVLEFQHSSDDVGSFIGCAPITFQSDPMGTISVEVAYRYCLSNGLEAVSYRQVLAGLPTTPPSSFGFPQFDPALGNLRSVRFDVRTTLRSDTGIENVDASQQIMNFLSESGFLLRGVAAPAIELGPFGHSVNGVVALEPFDGTVDFSGPSGTRILAEQNFASTRSFSSGFAPFLGNGQVELQVVDTSSFSQAGSPAPPPVVETDHRADIEVDLVYVFFRDCNANDVPDWNEVCAGSVADVNGNGIPDACEFAPGDCNDNGIPDVTDIGRGTSDDCDGDGIPDECETDCNGNGIADDCDIDSGGSVDADGDGLPDECGLNCNGDSIPDVCERDLNFNGQPDECETVTDCNNNQMPDAFDIFYGVSQDINGNGVPDECEFVCLVPTVLRDAGTDRLDARMRIDCDRGTARSNRLLAALAIGDHERTLRLQATGVQPGSIAVFFCGTGSEALPFGPVGPCVGTSVEWLGGRVADDAGSAALDVSHERLLRAVGTSLTFQFRSQGSGRAAHREFSDAVTIDF